MASGLKYTREVSDSYKFDDDSFLKFRREALARLEHDGTFQVGAILETLATPPRTADEFAEYGRLMKAGVSATQKLLNELRDHYVRDENGKLVEGEDGDWAKKDVIPAVYPVAADGSQAWGAGKEMEGIVLAATKPDGFRTYVATRTKLVQGAADSLNSHIRASNALPGPPVPPLLVSIED